MSYTEELCNAVNALSIQNSTLDCFLETIAQSKYVQSCKSKKSKDKTSISSLIDRSLSQSDCIKIGIAIEDVLRNFIKNNISDIVDIKEKNVKNKKEKDHVFIDEANKVIYYAEIKANLNLDTEKYKATIAKCIDIHAELTSKFSGYIIKMYLVGARYLYAHEMSKAIHKKYSVIQGNLIGVNDYLSNLGYKGNLLNDDIYRTILNTMANSMFDK
jgi:hypothetical protein